MHIDEFLSSLFLWRARLALTAVDSLPKLRSFRRPLNQDVYRLQKGINLPDVKPNKKTNFMSSAVILAQPLMLSTLTESISRPSMK